MPTLKEKLTLTEQQVLEGKTAIANALMMAGVTAVEPNPNNPDVYEIFQSYADKIKRLMISNSFILEFDMNKTTKNTKLGRTIMLPVNNTFPIYSTSLRIIEEDRAEQSGTTRSISSQYTDTQHLTGGGYNSVPTVEDHFGNLVADGTAFFDCDELSRWLSTEDSDVLTGLGMAVETMAEPLADEDIPDYEFTVDWGDGTTSEFKSLSETPDAWYHTYETKGVYTVSVNGYFREVFSKYNSSGYAIEDGEPVYDTDGTLFYNENYAMQYYLTKVIAWGNTRFTNLAQAFYLCRNLSSIPVTDTTASFTDVISCGAMFGSTQITSIPYDTNTGRGLFSGMPNVTSFTQTFDACRRLTGEIPPALIDACPKVTTVNAMFRTCVGLSGTIPTAMFKGMTNLQDASACFNNCSGLTGEIPVGIFDDCPNLKTTSQMFLNCVGLTGTVPALLFANNPMLTSAVSMFYGCVNLSGVDRDMFAGRDNTNLAAALMFYCSGVQNVPEGFFAPLSGDGCYIDYMFATGLNSLTQASLTSVSPTVLDELSQVPEARSVFVNQTNIATEITPRSYATLDEIARNYGVFANCGSIPNLDQLPSELGGMGGRAFPDSDIGKICLSNHTFVDHASFTYDAQNPPIGVVTRVDGDQRTVAALNGTTNSLVKNQLTAYNQWETDNPLPNITPSASNYWGYSGQTMTDLLRAHRFYVEDPSIYPALQWIDAYVTSGTSAGDWWIPSMTDVYDRVWLCGGLACAATKRIIDLSDGDYTAANCYTQLLSNQSTIYKSTVALNRLFPTYGRYINVGSGVWNGGLTWPFVYISA